DVGAVAHRPAGERGGVPAVLGLDDLQLGDARQRMREHVTLAGAGRGRSGVGHHEYTHRQTLRGELRATRSRPAAWPGLGLVRGLCARGLLRLRSAARTPVIVLQVLAIPVAYDIAFPAGRPAIGGPILAAVLAVLYLLFTPPAREALDRDI